MTCVTVDLINVRRIFIKSVIHAVISIRIIDSNVTGICI